MPTTTVRTTLLAASLLAGLPWIRSGSTVPRDAPAAATPAAEAAAPPAAKAPAAAATGKHQAPPPDRVVLLGVKDPDYLALAIPRSYKTSPDAPNHLLVFRGGLCVRDIGLADNSQESDTSAASAAVVEETGATARGFVARDGTSAVVLRTRYVSRVDMSPQKKSTAGDTVTGDTTVTLVDPTHPDGRWRVTLENSRWAKDVVVIPAEKGVVLTTFIPRTGPADVRVLDATGHEMLRVPESSGDALHIDASPDGAYVAAEVAFRNNPLGTERGVIVFDLSDGSQWTYVWHYGSDAEPLSWELREKGVLAVKLPGGVRRFDPKGRKL